MSRTESDPQERENIIHAAAIRAALCAARGLAESQACHPPGCADHSEDALNMVRNWPECDTEGGSHD